MKKHINRTTIRLVLIILMILSLAINQGLEDQEQPSILSFSKTPEKEIIFRKLVYISGEVSKPGVYEVGEDTRISEVIDMAGGFTIAADLDKVYSSVNLAKIATDEEKIFIPNLSTNTVKNTVNLNTSTQKELEKLPGIGPVTAGQIISIRPITGLSDLAKIKNFSEKKILEIKDLVSL